MLSVHFTDFEKEIVDLKNDFEKMNSKVRFCYFVWLNNLEV